MKKNLEIKDQPDNPNGKEARLTGKIGFISLGCPKNLVDSEVMMGKLAKAGYSITADEAEAETIVVNTCGFIEAAKQESIEAILEAAELKSKGKAKKLVVAGCLVERYRDELAKELTEVDTFIGTSQIEKIVEAISESQAAGRLLEEKIGGKTANYLYDHTTPRFQATPRHTAFIKIAEGCDRPCAFCSIPQMRGSFRSRSFGSIIAEAKSLAERGVREVVLVAQDSSRYGEDFGKKDLLAELLRALGEISGLHWIRLMYAYPTHISDAFLKAMAETPKVAKYLDMPLQHASGKILKLMKRGGNRQSLERLIGRVRERVPSVAIRTTFITGFPGETEEDFQELIAFVKNCRFENVGVFTYSDEEGTPAFELGEKVDKRVANSRKNRLMKEQAKISRELNRARVGKRFTTMFEGKSAESDLLLKARLEGQAADIDGHILINDVAEGIKPKIGELYRVEITQALDYDLIGRIISPI
jgi:ribosomal protein S12 methylthiotransferase